MLQGQSRQSAQRIAQRHYALKIVSQLVKGIDEKDRCDILDKVVTKLINRPNSKYDQLWLQNITLPDDSKRKKLLYEYDFPLCQLVDGKKVELWDNSWLLDEHTDGFPYSSIVVETKLPTVPSIITFREIRGYNEWLDSLDYEDFEAVQSMTAEDLAQREVVGTFTV